MKNKIVSEVISIVGLLIIGGLLGWAFVSFLDKWVAHEQAYQQAHQQYIAPADEVIIEIMNKESDNESH